MKRLFIIFAILTISLAFYSNSYAQKQKVMNLRTYNQQKYHFGFILAANQMHFTVKTVDDLPLIKWTGSQIPDDIGLFGVDTVQILSVNQEPSPGFTIGILGSLLLHEYVDMRFTPSLSFGDRFLRYDILTISGVDSSNFPVSKEIQSTLIEFPLDFKYRSKRLNNFDAYVLLGVSYTLDLATQKVEKNSGSDQITVKINKSDVTINAGVGVDFYTQYFKFGIELKMGYGVFNLIQQEDNLFTNSIESLHSKLFLLSFTFE